MHIFLEYCIFIHVAFNALYFYMITNKIRKQ